MWSVFVSDMRPMTPMGGMQWPQHQAGAVKLQNWVGQDWQWGLRGCGLYLFLGTYGTYLLNQLGSDRQCLRHAGIKSEH